ncbi:MAG: hypothetical protein M1819_000879 [Sarea resinae]|nr:MAG: hypothetical protein M1819_000879 [Sarea resinae]
MAPKSQKGGPAGGPKEREDDREDSLQAVVLTDTFETRFNPFTLERPRCLLPLANTPMIEYTFEFLANAGVEDIFVYCGAHTEQVEDYIRNSKWSLPSSPFTKLEIIRSTSRSVGDAMRDLDNRDLITGDFLVVSGDVVSNLPLEAALAKHRARRAADKNAIMTMILREAGAAHRTKAQGAEPVFIIDPAKERCLHYEEMHPGQSEHVVNIDPELLSSHAEIEIRRDLIDCRIDICTPDVLALWTDSFDYESPRKHFLYGVLKDYELNGKTIHTHVVSDHYAARVRNLQAYDAISKDIVSRWAYPLCPDSNLLRGQSYELQRGNIYKEEGVALARSCVVRRRTVIGHNTSIGDGSVVSNSIIGRRCQIGKNVKIDGSYIWDDAVVGDGSEVRQAIVANDAIVGKNCVLEPGALVSYAVRLADRLTVSGTRRLTRGKRKRGNEDRQFEPSASDPSIVGESGEGHDYTDSEDSEQDEENRSSGLIYNMANLAVSDSSISTLSSQNASDEAQHAPHHARSEASSFATTLSDDSGAPDDFHHDAASSMFDSLQRGDASDVVQLELIGLRMSANASDHQVRRAVVAAFMKRVQQVMETPTPRNPTSSNSSAAAPPPPTPLGASDAVALVFGTYKELIERTIFDKKDPTTTEKPDQVDFLLAAQTDLVHRPRGDAVLLFVCKTLYDLDVLDEEAFAQWWADDRSRESEDLRRVRALSEQFVRWLEEAEESESSSSGGSDDDDEEEDDEDEAEGGSGSGSEEESE